MATCHCNFATFNRVVDTKTSIIQMEPNVINVGQKMNLYIYTCTKFLLSQNILVDLKVENIICTMDDVRGDFLGKVSFRLLNKNLWC